MYLNTSLKLISTMNIYKVLGIERHATKEQIREVYRKLAIKYHPDQNHGKEEIVAERFKEIQCAFETLNNDAKRSAWDRKHPVRKKGQPIDPSQDPNLGNCGVPEAPTHDIWGNKLTAEERAAWVANASGGATIYPKKKKYIKPKKKKKKKPRDNTYWQKNHYVDNGNAWVDSQWDRYQYDDDQPNVR